MNIAFLGNHWLPHTKERIKNLKLRGHNIYYYSWPIEGEQNQDDVKSSPEKFSPNVLYRPIFQEYILPNICYIGGPAEVAYWLQLKSVFESLNIAFPIILNRNSALLLDKTI